MEILFLISLFLIFFAYFGYPVSLFLLGCLRNRAVKKAPYFPAVTMIITAFNEEKRIREKLENSIGLEYPREKFQVLVASDGSTDNTNDIVREYEIKGVELFVTQNRQGKENAQKEALKLARGSIIVFSDVATILDPNGVQEIVFNFADPTVGCVSSEDSLIGADGRPGGEGLYVRYEMWLRRLESRVNSLVGLSGSFFAARKEVFQDFSGEMQSDFRTLLNSMKMGLRGISDPAAIGYYHDVSDERREFDRKIRTVLRGITVFLGHIGFLNFFRYRLFSYQYFCHKLLRWLVPFFLVLAFAANLVIAPGSPLYTFIFFTQVIFYGLGIWAWKRKKSVSNTALKVPLYFLTVNASILMAWWRYMKGQRIVMWKPSER
jgi:glycosyltransferase involved in cell wall biosynthesis